MHAGPNSESGGKFMPLQQPFKVGSPSMSGSSSVAPDINELQAAFDIDISPGDAPPFDEFDDYGGPRNSEIHDDAGAASDDAGDIKDGAG